MTRWQTSGELHRQLPSPCRGSRVRKSVRELAFADPPAAILDAWGHPGRPRSPGLSGALARGSASGQPGTKEASICPSVGCPGIS